MGTGNRIHSVAGGPRDEPLPPAHALPALLLLLVLAAPAAAEEKARIFVDQWSPTRSVLYIAEADGSDPRKLLAGSDRNYNASFSRTTASGWCSRPSATARPTSSACAPTVSAWSG